MLDGNVGLLRGDGVKQILGFAVFGGWLTLLASALRSRSDWGTSYVSASFVAGSADASGMNPWVETALIGLLGGAVTGAVLRILGFTMAGPLNNKVTRVVLAGLAGSGLGVGIAVAVAFGSSRYPGTVGVLAIYAACGILAYVLALTAIWLVLRLSGVTEVRKTLQTTAIALIPGAVVAIAAGVGTAWMLDFTTDESTWVAVIAAVIAVLAITFAVAQTLANGRGQDSGTPMPAPRADQ